MSLEKIIVCLLVAIIGWVGGMELAKAEEPASSQRALGALQPIANQRNAAFDQLALCQGDMEALRAELAAAKAEVEKLKPPTPAK